MDGGFGALLLPLLFLVVLYLLLIRPQQRRQKEHQRKVADLQVGNDVVTIGGLHGRITALTDDTMDLLVTDDVVLRYQRSALARIVADDADDADDE